MRAKLNESFTPVSVTVTIETQAELENLEHVYRAVSKGCVDNVHAWEQRDTLIALAVAVYTATPQGDNQ